MKNYYLFVFLILLVNCRNSQNESFENQSNHVFENEKDSLKIQTHHFNEIKNSGILIFPLEMSESDYKRKTDYKDVGNYGYWNLLFYNSHTSEYHLLSKDKMIIERYSNEYLEDNDELKMDLPYLFYTIKKDDFNQDRLLDEKDPTYLFITDLEGKNLKQISPKNMHLVDWEYIKSSKSLIISSKVDSDKNKKFDHYDEIRTYILPIDSLDQPRELFNEEFKKELKELFKRDWKKIK